MQPELKTERLIIRELLPGDAEAMFEMDSDPEVHRFLGNRPVGNIAQIYDVIDLVRQQYIENGIGRWAMVHRETGHFIGWTGLKFHQLLNGHQDIYELGYRLLQKYWGQGYATESALASLEYGFNVLQQEHIYAITDPGHANSMKVLEKVGFSLVEVFDFDQEPTNWYSISRKEWEQGKR